MPYFVYRPGTAKPYVLDDEDSHYTTYFDRWGWVYEHRPSTDSQILTAIKREEKSRRKPIYIVWEEEYRRRIHEEEKHITDQSKAIKKAEKETTGKTGLKTKVSMLFKKKQSGERPGYKDGLYVNHLEDLQKKWFENDGTGQA